MQPLNLSPLPTYQEIVTNGQTILKDFSWNTSYLQILRLQTTPILKKMISNGPRLWRCGEPFQIGKMTWKNGATYDGGWTNRKPEGLGNFIYPEFKHEKTYRGKWVGGKRTGFGFLSMNDGDEYFGDFEQDEITGG